MNALIPGLSVVWKQQRWILVDIPSIAFVLIRDPASDRVELVPPAEIRIDAPAEGTTRSLVAVSKEAWREASKRFEALRPLLNRGTRERTLEEVDLVAKSFGRDRATIYRWITKWNRTKTVSALVRSGRSDVGKSRLAPEVEKLVAAKIESFYLVPERPTMTELHEQIAIACKDAKMNTPTLSTVQRRVHQLAARTVMARRIDAKTARERFEPLRGSFPGADVPLAVYQIDHSPIDVSFVDEKHRRHIGRGYLTIVADSCSRVLAGFCVSFDPPGALATGLALTHAILPKATWLAERGISASWPVYGKPAKVYADNAQEFRGTMLSRACQEYDIVLENRPKGLPNYGGHIERLFRTFMKRSQSLRGSTFSNVEQKGEYDSDGKAIMTLEEYTKWFSVFVTKVYHQRPHRGIGRVPPIKLFERFILGFEDKKGIGLPQPIADEHKLRLDFMPYVERTIQEYGVVIDNIYYYADVLRPWVHARDPGSAKLKRKFIFARDPRDISEVYFLDPETKTYYPVPYRDITRERMSVWELNAILKKITEDPSLQPDEDTIFEGLREMSQIHADAGAKSRRVRRAMQRKADWNENAEAAKPRKETAKSAPRAQMESALDDDADWAAVARPFDDIEEAE